jgi:hypothetical protein
VANGKPGDHPLTDILVYHRQVFSSSVDELIAELDGVGVWDGELTPFLLLSLHGEVIRLREQNEEAGVTLLNNFEEVLRDEKARLIGPAAQV